MIQLSEGKKEIVEMFCPSCGKMLNPGATFCTDCGAVAAAPFGNQREMDSSSAQPNQTGSLANGDRGKPVLITCAGIGSLLCALIWLLVASDQFERATNRNGLAAVGMWNLVTVVIYAVIGVGIFMRKKWAWDWGRGSNTINLLLGVYQLTQGVTVQVILLPIELFILIALYFTKPSMASNRNRQKTVGTNAVSALPGTSNAALPTVAPTQLTELKPRMGTMKILAWSFGVLLVLVCGSAALYISGGSSTKDVWAKANSQLVAANTAAATQQTPTGAMASKASDAPGAKPTVTEPGQAAQTEASAPVQQSAPGATNLQSCISGGQTPELACLSEELDRQDARLNQEYQRVVAQYRQLGQGDNIVTLRKVELEWIKHVTSDCNTSPPDFMGNPDQRRIQCRLDVTKARADELAKMPL